MTPPVVVVTRRATEDFEVDGYIVPKGWNVNFGPAGKHSRFEETKTFSIERHLDQGKFLDRTFDPSYFNSFGGGSRMCIGLLARLKEKSDKKKEALDPWFEAVFI